MYSDLNNRRSAIYYPFADYHGGINEGCHSNVVFTIRVAQIKINH